VQGSAERPLAELLASLAERTPAPGGGSAAAWSAAIAAALLEMAAAYAGADAEARLAASLRARLVEEGDRELRSYEPVLAALRLPASDPSRERSLSRALSAASEAPLSIAHEAAEVAELAAAVAARSKPALQGDAVAAVLLAESACRAAARLVEINLHGSGDSRLIEVATVADAAAAARGRALARAI
jgi:methenyltetrahydrofolate cyclohydrolase